MLLYFLAGMFFASFLWPILDAFATVCMAWLEVGKGKASMKVAKMNKEAQELLTPEDPPKRQIGFCVPLPEEVEEDEEDYDD